MNKVWVTVIGIQKDAFGEENRIELTTTGTQHFKNGVHYILYEDSEISGMEGTTTLIKASEQRVSLIRKGSVAQEQHFELGKKSDSVYATPHGKLRLSVLTHKLDVDCGVAAGNLEITYELSIDGKWQSENQLQIQICADQAGCAGLH